MRLRVIRKQYIFLILVLLLVFPSFILAQKDLLEGEEKRITRKKLPKWVYEHEDDEIVGISGKFSTEKEARRDALFNARKQIVDRLGVQLTTEQKERILEQSDDAGSGIVNTGVQKEIVTQAISRALIRVRAKKYFIEKYATKRLGMIEYFYIAYTLVPFSKEEHDRMMETAFNEYHRDFLNSINDLNFVDANNLGKSINTIQLLHKLCENARNIIGMRPEFLAKIDSWENKLNKRQSEIWHQVKISPMGELPRPERNGKLGGPISVQVKFDKEPVENLSLSLFSGSKVIAAATTDSQGIARFEYSKPVLKTLNFEITFSNAQPGNAPSYHYSANFTPVVLVAVTEWNTSFTQQERIIASSIAQTLNQNKIPTTNSNYLTEIKIEGLIRGNFRYLDSMDDDFGYVLFGKVAVPSVLKASYGNLYQAKANCKLKLLDAVDKNEIWTLMLDSEYLLGPTPDEAGRRAKMNLAAKVAEALSEFLSNY